MLKIETPAKAFRFYCNILVILFCIVTFCIVPMSMSLSLQSSVEKVPRVLGYSINSLNLLHTGFIKRCLHSISVGDLPYSLLNMFITAVAPLSDTRGIVHMQIVTTRSSEARSKYERASPRRHSEVRDEVVDGAVGRSKKPNPVSHKKEAAKE